MEEALTALLASVAGGRRHWVRVPQGTPYPNVVLNKIDAFVNYHLQGASGYVSSRVQIDVYAAKFAEANTIAGQIKALLSGHSGGDIQAIFIESERNLPAADAGEVTSLFRTSIDITVHYGETP
jgi:hypothetical protein